MRLIELATMLDLELTVRFNRDTWIASFYGVDFKDSPGDLFLSSGCGWGSTPEVALRNLVGNIRGRIAVSDPSSPTKRKEFTIPLTLEA